MTELGTRLANLRTEKGLTQKKLASLLNMSGGTISNYENGVHSPDPNTLCRLADFYCVTTDYLLGREVPNAGAPQTLDITGLTPRQIEHIQLIVDDLRQNEH